MHEILPAQMVINRTRQDAYEAVKVRDEKIKKSQPLSEMDNYHISHGFLNIEDMNRIDGAIYQCVDRLKAMGYHNIFLPYLAHRKEWAHSDHFSRADWNRWITAVRLIRLEMPPIADYDTIVEPCDFTGVNSIEKNLQTCMLNIVDVHSFYAYCGEIYSGDR